MLGLVLPPKPLHTTTADSKMRLRSETRRPAQIPLSCQLRKLTLHMEIHKGTPLKMLTCIRGLDQSGCVRLIKSGYLSISKPMLTRSFFATAQLRTSVISKQSTSNFATNRSTQPRFKDIDNAEERHVTSKECACGHRSRTGQNPSFGFLSSCARVQK